MTLRNSRYGKFYGCTRWPDCKGAHGAHQGDGRPLGTPADRETKQARIAAHDAFDRYWRGRMMPRKEAYRRLAAALGIDRSKCHIGMFDRATCERVIEICRSGQLVERESA